MKFKVGDRIKVTAKIWWIDKYITNKVGVITKVDLDRFFHYTIDIGTIKIPVGGNEIELYLKKGQQLLFSFMSEIIQ